MRLSLARAALSNTELLLLDEPTNHLDKNAVAWLEEYLVSPALSNVTVVIVSHEPRFLDAVISDVIHMSKMKLLPFEGSFTAFKEACPKEAAEYLSAGAGVGSMKVTADRFSMTFPQPSRLDGVGSDTKAV